MGDARMAFKRGTEILIGEFIGDAATRVAGKFGMSRLLQTMRVPPQFVLPVSRIGVGLLFPMLMKQFAPRMFKPSFRQTFAAVNVASGLIGLTNNIRNQAFNAMGLSEYDMDLGLVYDGMYDWETADGGVGDWETADGGMGGYELADAPPHGVLGDAPPAGVLDYSYL